MIIKPYVMQQRTIIFIALVLFFASCEEGANSRISKMSSTAAPEAFLESADSTTFASDISSITSPSRKIIRTADLRCRVNNVFDATTEVEKLVTSFGGIVQQSEMRNEVMETITVYYKPDSNKQTQSYTTTAQLTLRVPSAHTDSVINAIPKLAAFVDYRTLSQSDVTYDYLGNALKNEMIKEKPLKNPMALARKTDEAINADKYDNEKENLNIARRLENLHLLDEVNYSTITVAFYQPMKVSSVVVMNPDYYARPSFAVQAYQSVAAGFDMLRVLFIFLLQIWPLWLIALFGLWLYKKAGKRIMRRSI
jgi:hypothetical protein